MTATLTAIPAKPLQAAGAFPAPGSRMLTLTLSDQATRRPLAPWSDDLVRDLESSASEPITMERCRVLVGAANAAALVLTNAGRSDDAERICHAQIAWVRAVADRTDQPHLATLVLQPWINLGRLRGLAGRTDDALRHFAEVGACRTGAPSRLAGRTIEPDHWVAAGWDVGVLERFGRAVLLSDSVRVLLAAGRFAEVAALGEQGSALEGGRVPAVLQEARLVALARAGRVGEALELAQRLRVEARGWDKIILQLRWAELVGLSGEGESAARAVRELLGVCGRLPVADGLQLPVLFAVQAVCALGFTLGLAAETVPVAAALRTGAHRHDDEVMEFEVLRLLAAHAAAGAERDGYRDALRRLGETTAYARMRPAECPAESAAKIDHLLRTTLGVLNAD